MPLHTHKCRAFNHFLGPRPATGVNLAWLRRVAGVALARVWAYAPGDLA